MSKPQLSITLPRGYKFPEYGNGQFPKTPEPEETSGLAEPLVPPKPPKQPYRIRRRRPVIPDFSEELFSQDNLADTTVPTIEVAESSVACPQPLRPANTSALSAGFLSPLCSSQEARSPPKTPLKQIASIDEVCKDNYIDWSGTNTNHFGDSVSRPSSSASGLSDSSVSSDVSFDSYPSFGGSNTSPESECADPFLALPPKLAGAQASSPSPARPEKALRSRRKMAWNDEMDKHLWITYMMYLQDPRVTPFKVLPGKYPPVGACQRVANVAKKTWVGARTPSVAFGKPALASGNHRSGYPDTIKPTDNDGSNFNKHDTQKLPVKWPHSEKDTRKRLRRLCKKNGSLPTHYSRLLQIRSPSPFSSSSPRPRSSRLASPPTGAGSSFSTRDMNISLAMSTSEDMMARGPLSQLAAEPSTPNRPANPTLQPHSSMRSSSHQKSQSLHFGFSLDRSPRSLASPFHDNQEACAPSSSLAALRPAPLAVPELGPPIDLTAPIPPNRSLKRKTGHKDYDTAFKGRHQNLMEELCPIADSAGRRVRLRGFSLNDAGRSAQRLSSLFIPPPVSESSPQVNRMPAPSPMDTTFLAPPQNEGASIKRLGSPFNERAAQHHFNTFPRNFSPANGLDADMNLDDN
ncbi:MAG: hypothetical protein M1820_009461 [Bogoriella megaspora]|nr:MAG: hypothetical protein M1820_009461 [Bogoriella megaspora]